MIEVAQEETNTVVNAVAAEVEVETPVAAVTPPAPTISAPAQNPVVEVIQKSKRAAKAVVTEAKTEEVSGKILISAEEHKTVLLMENEFLKATAQIAQLQRQAETIQKRFPDYIKSLATKYAIDVNKNQFNAIEGSFSKL